MYTLLNKERGRKEQKSNNLYNALSRRVSTVQTNTHKRKLLKSDLWDCKAFFYFMYWSSIVRGGQQRHEK